MQIKQFEDSNLSHYAYAIISDNEMALIDPARDPQPYYELAKANAAIITTVIETHPHADFVSSHLEIHQTTGAIVYVSNRLGAEYPHQTFDEGDEIQLGKVTLKALNTPGHSPDSISIILTDETGKDMAVFTGDTLFIGDCGRPDLRENVGAIQEKREKQARQLFHSLKKYLSLDNDVQVYPAHGSGSLCGRALSSESRSTVGAEKLANWCLQPMDEDEFVVALLEGQPFVPKYFSYAVELNRKGAPVFKESVLKVPIGEPIQDQQAAGQLDPNVTIIDTRPQQQYKKAHLPNSINLQIGSSLETWLGSLLSPFKEFYLAAEDERQLLPLIARIAKIGYEPFIKKAFVLRYGNQSSPITDVSYFQKNQNDFLKIDVRNNEEAGEKFFEESLKIPLHELQHRTDEIPLDKPVIVYCAGGYRSAAAASIIQDRLKDKIKVFDLGEEVTSFKKKE